MHNNNEKKEKKKKPIMKQPPPSNYAQSCQQECHGAKGETTPKKQLRISVRLSKPLHWKFRHRNNGSSPSRSSGKELQIILPLTKLVPNFHTSKSPKMDQGRARTQSYQLKNRIPNHFCNIAAQKKMVYGFLIHRHMGKS